MSRLSIETPGRAETVVEGLYRDVERRISASPPGLCPVDMALSFLRLSHAQTCGKCVPCRIGLGQLTELLESVRCRCRLLTRKRQDILPARNANKRDDTLSPTSNTPKCP